MIIPALGFNNDSVDDVFAKPIQLNFWEEANVISYFCDFLYFFF